MSRYGKWKMENGNMELHFEQQQQQMQRKLYNSDVIRRILCKGIFTSIFRLKGNLLEGNLCEEDDAVKLPSGHVHAEIISYPTGAAARRPATRSV